MPSRAPSFRTAGSVLLVALAYFAAGRLGLALAYEDTNISPVWPPSGIAFAALFLLGLRAWPGVFLGAATVNLTNLTGLALPEALAVSCGIAVGNTLEAVVGAHVLRRLTGATPAFTTIAYVLRFAAVAVAACLLSAVAGASLLVHLDLASSSDLWLAIGTWWVGDAVAVVVIAPVLILIGRDPEECLRSLWDPESMLSFGLLAVATAYLFGVAGVPAPPEIVSPYLALVPLLWIAVRLPCRCVSAASLLVATLAVAASEAGHGPFSSASLHERRIEVQLFLGAGTLSALLLSAAVQELRLSKQLLGVEGERRFRELLDAMPEMVWLAGPDVELVDLNRAWLEFRGRARSDELGRGWLEGVHPDDLDEVTARFDQAFRTSRPTTFEFRLRRADGEYRWVLTTASASLGGGDEVRGYIGSCIDITERKTSEESIRQLDAAVEHALTGVARLDAEGRFTMVREGYARLLGWPADELVGESWDVTVPEEARPRGRAALDRMSRDGRAELETTGLRRDGSTFTKQLLLAPAYDERGERDGHYCFMRDVTEEVRAREDREALQAELRQAQRLESVGTLASGLAHDFNNFLTAILGLTEVTELDLGDRDKTRDNLQLIKGTARRAAGVSRSLLAFAQRGSSETKPVALASVVDEMLRSLGRLLPDSIEVETDMDQDVWVEADVLQLHQVLLNLALNGRDAMPEGGRLGFTLKREGGEAVLRVSDTGHGMEPNTLERVFDPFFTTKTREQGTGLGLSVVHGIVRDHGGRITMESISGEGTTAELRLPACPRGDEAPSTSTARTGDPSRGGTILVVEDNPDVSELVRHVLERRGFEVLLAGDGRQGLALFAERADDVDLALLDLELPKVSGLACAAAIRERRPALPVVFMSGNAGAHLAAEQRERETVISKPFRLGALLDLVVERLGRPRA